ncbi:hypothetical protein [uncultured Lacinutrix sp.]|uniref:hypothetical protein n=1 Tax=uncultured Lacinutrix sp. TaxID=574032 RepID=UPI002602B173|nr:hypothetical protein [uncultured Lacinutrix sp.]
MKIFTLAVLLNITFCFAQKSYVFDTLLEYDCKSITPIKDSTFTKYLYTNSKNNSYYITIKNLDSLNYSLEFVDTDKHYSKVKVLKNKLFKSAEIDILDCKDVANVYNQYKNRIKDYKFINLQDTLINNILLKNYKLTYVKSKKKKTRKKIGAIQYIIKEDTEFHSPILLHPTAYNEWKKEKNIPNGIYEEFLFYDFNNNLTSHYKLKKIKRVKLKLNTAKPCPKTKITIQG